MNVYVKIIVVFFTILLVGCQQETVTGPVESVGERIISIEYDKPSDGTEVGMFLEVVTTDETIFEDSSGNEIMLKDITTGDKGRAFLEGQQNAENNSEGGEPKADKVVLLEN